MSSNITTKISSGEFTLPLARDRAVDHWLLEQVAPAFDALKAEPSRAVTVSQVRARLAAEHAKAR